MANGRASGVRSSAQLGLFGPNSYSSKTPHESQPGDGMSSSASLWRSDIPGATESCQPLMLALRICVEGGGCLLPTLTVFGNWNKKDASDNSGDGLATKLRLLPTLTRSMATWADFMQAQYHSLKRPTYQEAKSLPTLCASDYKSPYSEAGYQKQILKRSKPLRDTLAHTTGHRLTQGFAEWWMGWPINSTALRRLVTGKFRSKPLRRG